MNNVELFDGERLELGDVVLQHFAANVNLAFEVIGINPEFAIVCRRTNQGLDINNELKIPVVLQRDNKQTAYRPTSMENVTLH